MILPLVTSPVIILLADDDNDDREMFAEVLSELDCSVQLECVEDGIRLLKFLQKENQTLPHLIFLDLNMPHKNGKECLEEIRHCNKFDHIPVIIYSTSSSPKDVEDTFSKGANLYVRKPSSFRELKNMTKKVLMLDWDKHQPYMVRNSFVFSGKSV